MREKKSALGGLIRAAAFISLFVPYQFERTEEGFKLKSIAVSVECRRIRTDAEAAEAPDEADAVVTVCVPGIVADQVNTMKELSVIAKDLLLKKKESMKEKILAAKKAAEAAADAAEDITEAVAAE